MPLTPSPKPTLIPKDELEKQLTSLKVELAPDSPGKARARLRDVCEWAADHCADITIDVLNAVPGGSAGVPIFKVVLGIAMLNRDAREATGACTGLRERLLNIYEESYELRQLQVDPIDGKMDAIFQEFVAHVKKQKTRSKWRQGLAKDKTLDLVNNLTEQIKALQANYNMPALRKIAADVKNVAAGVEDVAAGVENLTRANIPQNSPHPPLPPPPSLFGRDDAVAKGVNLLTTPNSHGATEHVVIVGVGGIGKTTLSQEIVHHPLLTHLGPPTFIRCQPVSTLVGFQKELLRLRKEAYCDSENLGDAVQTELYSKPRFLVLDNLFDSPSAVPADFLPYLSLLADIPNVTFLITTRNGDLAKVNSARRIQRFNVPGLSRGPAEELFRDEFGREPSSYSLQPDDPDLLDLLQLLDGIPLAIKLVAARARSERSVRDVVQLWKQGQAWDSGTLVPNRQNSVEVSLSLSFEDKSLEAADAINLLYILADLQDPVPRRPAPPLVHLAMEAALRCSLVQSEVGDKIEMIRVLEPVRQYIHWRQSKVGRPVDAHSPVVRELALYHLMTPLYIASRQGNIEDVTRLAAGAGDLDQCLAWGGGQTPLSIASDGGVLEVVACLLKAGAAVDAKTGSGTTALHGASVYGRLEVVRYLLQAGATVNTPEVTDGWTALHHAAMNGSVEVVEHLLQAGAALNLKTPAYGLTALHEASWNGNFEVVECLLQAGAAVDVTSLNGLTALSEASREGKLKVVECLLRAGAAVDAKGEDADTALLQASRFGYFDVVERLLQAGAAVNTQDVMDGKTALHAASFYGKRPIVAALLVAGADPSIKDAEGLTASAIAWREGHLEVIEELERWSQPSPPVPTLPDSGHSSKPIMAKNRYTSFFMAKFGKRDGPAEASGSGGAEGTIGDGSS